MRAIWLLLVVSMAAMAAIEQRTWTFSQDGKMQSPSGDEWSFKKKGRLDAALVGLEGTNVILLGAADGQYRIIAVTNLSEVDRAYLLRAKGMSESEGASIQQTVTAKNAAPRRKMDAARLKAEAASKRRVAQLEIEAAERLENDSGRLGSRAGSLEYQADHRARVADRIENSPVVGPRASLAYVTTKGDATLKSSAADRLGEDSARLRREAADKRANAQRLDMEAADLEKMARYLELGAASQMPVTR